MTTPALPTILAIAAAAVCLTCACAENVTDYENNSSVNLFREYVRINTSQPSSGDANYTEAVEFWQEQAASIGLNATVFEYYSGKPIVVITWQGSDPTLPSIMLNSHMDVVAADESEWTHPPFEAYMDADGNIYGRGTQDMKCVGIWYLEAVRQLMADNVTLARTIHMTMVPDEEIGGIEGMEAFIATDDFANLNVGMALDEGIAYPNSSYIVFYADKTPWQVVVTCTGPSGHGSTMPADTAAGKFRKVIDSFLNYRDTQLAIMVADPTRDAGTITSINLTKVSGGTATNIIPDSMSATFDIRLAVGTNQTAFNETINTWISDAGGDDCSASYILQDEVSPATVIDDSNPFWVAFKNATDAMDMQVIAIVSPGSTDERFVRTKNVSGLGFSPMPNTPYLLHSVDELLNAGTFIDGIRIYYNIIKSIASSY